VTEQKWVVSEESLSWVVISQYWFYVRYVFVFCLFFLKEKKINRDDQYVGIGFSFCTLGEWVGKKEKKYLKNHNNCPPLVAYVRARATVFRE